MSLVAITEGAKGPQVAEHDQKLDIVKRMGDGELCSSLAAEFGVSIRTMQVLKKTKENIVKKKCSLLDQQGSLKRKRYTGVVGSDFEKIIYTWFIQQRDTGFPISGFLLMNKASTLAETLGRPNFKASTGWLRKFQQRHGIRMIRVDGERLSSDAVASDEFTKIFSSFIEIEGGSVDNVYNADETGLFWKCLPRKTLAPRNEHSAPGHKLAKERVTVMTCANATGTHKVPLLVIGKAKHPRAFKNVNILPVQYVNQTNAWMDRSIFKEWFTTTFIPAVEKKNGKIEKLILLLDNARSHPSAEELTELYPHCTVVFLPPNVTALIQPMDQGVIECTKRAYRKEYCRKLLSSTEGHLIANLEVLVKKWTILDCVRTVAMAWDSVSEQTLRNAWKKALQGESLPTDNDEDIGALQHLTSQLSSERVTLTETNEWLQVDNHDPGWRILTLEEITDSVLHNIEPVNVVLNEHGEDAEEDAEDTSNEETSMSNNDAYNALNGLYKWLASKPGADRALLAALDKVQSVAIDEMLNRLI
ncbi:PREDICTED: jerky protein homolog-like [Vollenhovia emeryi]|uniref:jerky protein homolog-like n=1 Tax=Vollenhovia emeryi TaxID=411798 RepID=UPI0005F4B188|nr:PREDICTED: jerky protein homolog-like [Vollenhovia emeryi]